MRLKVAASVLLLAALTVSVCAAQSHGVPASVTSFGFGGSRSATPGIPASVMSPGPLGFQCCINPLFPMNFNPPMGNFRFHHRHSGGFPVFVPLYGQGYQPVIVVPDDQASQYDSEDDDDAGGPTVFEHRGARRHQADEAYDRGYERGRAAEEARIAREERAAERASEPAPEKRAAAAKTAEQPGPAVDPKTVLVYRDGHKEEIGNYAIVGDELFDFTSGRRKIAVVTLDLPATTKANDERGMDFQLPVVRPGN